MRNVPTETAQDSDSESGVVVLEATFCILVCLLVIFFFLAFGFYVYQRVMFTTVANEVAEEVVQTYKLRYVSDSADMAAEDVSGIGKYRYLLFSWSFNYYAESKAETLATVRLQKTSFANSSGGLEADVETVVDDIGRRHYEVTITQEYGFMLGALFKAIGLEETAKLETTVYVDSFDVLNYVNTVRMTDYLIDKYTGDSSIFSMLNSVIKLIDTVIDAATD